jgi:hypothetical protein
VTGWQGSAPTAGSLAAKRPGWAATPQDKRSPIYLALVRERRYNPLASR